MGFYWYIGKGLLQQGNSSKGAFQEKVLGGDSGPEGEWVGREISQERWTNSWEKGFAGFVICGTKLSAIGFCVSGLPDFDLSV